MFENAVASLFGEVSPSREDELKATLERFRKHLGVKRVNRTYLVQISFRSTDRESAAAVANATAAAFIRDLLQSKAQVSSGVSNWLEPRLFDLRERVNAADRAVQQFKAQHDLVNVGARSLLQEQLGDLSRQLGIARARVFEEKAKLDSITALVEGDTFVAAASGVQDTTIISRLRQQRLDLQHRLDELVGSLGAAARGHPLVSQQRREIGQIDQSIREELKRQQASIRSDYEIAKDYENSLQSSIDAIKVKISEANQDQVTLSDLESAARSYRSLYDRMLEHSLALAQQQAPPFADAHIVSEASPPLRKSHPRSMIVLAAAGLIGLAAGAAAGAAREKLDRTIRSRGAVEAATGASFLAAVPAVASFRKSGAKQAQVDSVAETTLARFAIERGHSPFADAIGRVKLAADLARKSHRVGVLGVVTAVPGEGATTIASNLAQLLASGGRNVLLIDGNSQDCMLTRCLAPDSELGLVDVLKGKTTLGEVVRQDPVTGLNILPAPVADPAPSIGHLFSSDAARRLLVAAREQYECIVIDLPALCRIDARAASLLVDAFILVIEAGKTSQDDVMDALGSSPEVREKLLGAVLNKVRTQRGGDPRFAVRNEHA
ncbi:AAA family ATPase [Sinorhizobium meliloti]|uniref:AAA family ATPase n=1 Tax=Rhizobium meliloti TaxID=382 RepID=UPI002090736A|nr:AAA family ATPase [Sinorhizobium meliloti]MCO5965394.1 AAA family ATPase [Sinorhizobium meliloti]